MGVLKQLYEIPISEKVLPLIEVIQEKTKTNSSKDFIDELALIFDSNKIESSIMIDLIKTNIPNNIMPTVRDFLTKVNRKRDFYLGYFSRLKEIKNAIPVISYNPNSFDISNIIDDEKSLRSEFAKLAFRLTSGTFSAVFPQIRKVIKKTDFLILDIGSASHINPALRRMYADIDKFRSSTKCKTIIINSTKAKEVTNVGLEDGEPIFNIDNSLRETYENYQFDGFGDYACIINELPSSGGTISPAGIYYSYKYNYFIGYRRNKDLSEFDNYIAPAIVASDYWKEFSKTHHKTCPGCKTIRGIVQGTAMGKSQAKWKGITMSHYIYTISENLDKS